MPLKKLKHRSNKDEGYVQFEKLINEIAKKQLPNNIVDKINDEIEKLNSILDTSKKWKIQLRRIQSKIVLILAKELKIVVKNHYRNTWLVLGMVAIGMPIGIAFGMLFGNMGYLSLGFPIGIGVGLILGIRMDKIALKEGRQLDIVLKY